MVIVLDLFDMDLARLLQLEHQKESNVTCLSQWLDLCQQFASGLARLASCHVIHRDLHAKNILIRLSPLSLAIADFGKAAVGVVTIQSPMTSLVYVSGARPPEIWFCQHSKWNPDGSWKPPKSALYG